MIGETVVPVVVVLVGHKIEGATIVEVDADELRIPTLALSCAPQRISSETAEDIDRLLASADDNPGQLSLISDPLETAMTTKILRAMTAPISIRSSTSSSGSSVKSK